VSAGQRVIARRLDHVGFEVTDLARSSAFYDALFHPLGGRRIFDSPDAGALAAGGIGGRHRSVPITEYLARRWRERGAS
jgi:catechol 2,3-dioxygenase-like lactoylglutathione lyase family enzyme